jgi:two-component system OmpR family response regulator
MSLPKKKIVLVDDDTVFLKMLEANLMEHDTFDIETYPTGEQFLETISNSIDLVILDFHLNGINHKAMNGLETLAKIKAFNKEIPVIMLSSQDKIEVAIDCMHNGAIDYIVKSETAFFRVNQSINKLFEFKKIEKELSWYMKRM